MAHPVEFDHATVLPFQENVRDPVMVGDMVRTGPNLFPHFRVVAIDVDHNKTWLRNLDTLKDDIVPSWKCQKINGPLTAPVFS